ncbi:MAG: hypothetical protein ACYC3U_13250, partial [Georgenia sp.]
MSDTRLLLDGPELAPLIERAREIGGRVVKAERVHKGFGPFAHHGYVVTVDVPGLSTEPSTPDPGAVATPEAVRPPVAGGPSVARELRAGSRSAGGRAGLGTGSPTAGQASGLVGLEALLAAADGSDGVGPMPSSRRDAPVRHATSRKALGPVSPPPPPPPPPAGPDAPSGSVTTRTADSEKPPNRPGKRWSKPSWQRVGRPTVATTSA